MLKQHLIAINFLDEWIYVNPSTIRIENFTFPNIPSRSRGFDFIW